MPTYEEALAADPAAFVAYASEMGAAATDLTEHQTEYNSTVADINSGWQGQANGAVNEDVALVNTHVGDVVLRTSEAAELLQTGGSEMVSQVEQLKATDAAYRGAGFIVQPEPRVELGPVHWAAIVAAGPFGPVLQAMYQARADEGTVLLQTGLTALTVTDVATGASLAMAAEELEPLDDKGEPVGHEPPTVNQNGEDDDPGGNETVPEPTDGRKKTGDEAEKKAEKAEDEEESKDKGEDEDREEDEERDGGDEDGEEEPRQEEPETERPRDRQPDERTPEDRSPGAVPPSPPAPEATPFDPTVPEPSEYDGLWDPSELTGEEEPVGGLASGGVGGGGLGGGSAEIPSGGSGTGGVGGVFGAPSAGGTPSAPSGSGTRPGLGGGMVGAPGARGAAPTDEEYERESFLMEDPEEDVWGIGTDEDSPYAESPPRREEETGPAASVDELPPFTLPGFDLPGAEGARRP